MQEKITAYTEAFEDRFAEFLSLPRADAFPLTEQDRILVKNSHIILPAETKLSDWDMYCQVDGPLVTIPVLREMREFIRAWKGFDLVGDYTTDLPQHMESHAFQSVARHLHQIHFMGTLADVRFAPFFDIHLLGADREMMRAFYESIDFDSSDYVDWSILTCWRKMRRTGASTADEILYDPKLWSIRDTWIRSVLSLLSKEERAVASTDPLRFFSQHFRDRPEFASAVQLLEAGV